MFFFMARKFKPGGSAMWNGEQWDLCDESMGASPKKRFSNEGVSLCFIISFQVHGLHDHTTSALL